VARKPTTARIVLSTAVAWLCGGLVFFPIFWMALTSFKPEIEAATLPPVLFRFHATLDNYSAVLTGSDYLAHALNSVLISGGATALAFLLAVPAAWAMAFAPTKRTRSVLLWILSTKMMPAVGVLVPVYLISQGLGLLNTRAGLIAILGLSSLPIMVWMLFTYFKDVPQDILEAARMDGAGTVREIVHVLLPMTLPGLASAALLNFILSWNESFWTLNLSTSDAAPLTVFIAAFSSPEGLFWAKLSAASTLAVAPVMVLGWASQRQLVRGMTFGAVK
jgi:sorbitol/mannitol transport system permease protein